MEPGRKWRHEKVGTKKVGLPLKNLLRGTSLSHRLLKLINQFPDDTTEELKSREEEANTAKVPKPVG